MGKLITVCLGFLHPISIINNKKIIKRFVLICFQAHKLLFLRYFKISGSDVSVLKTHREIIDIPTGRNSSKSRTLTQLPDDILAILFKYLLPADIIRRGTKFLETETSLISLFLGVSLSAEGSVASLLSTVYIESVLNTSVGGRGLKVI